MAAISMVQGSERQVPTNWHSRNASPRQSEQAMAYTRQTVSLRYENSRGEVLQLDMESESMAAYKLELGKGREGSSERIRQFLDQVHEHVMEEHRRLLGALFPEFFDSDTAMLDPADVPSAEKTEGEEGPAVPEYWNAENTSDRIVAFATSFYSLFEGQPDEYYQKILAAVEKGFEEAMGALGELPGFATDLAEETMELTREKLQSWHQSVAQSVLTA